MNIVNQMGMSGFRSKEAAGRAYTEASINYGQVRWRVLQEMGEYSDDTLGSTLSKKAAEFAKTLDMDKVLQSFRASKQAVQGVPPGTGEGDLFNSTGTPVQSTMSRQANDIRAIRENTEPLKDLKRTILGGGEFAKVGVTPVEMGQQRGGPININSRASAEDIKRQVLQMRRQGLLA
jgi:hypothetical protein